MDRNRRKIAASLAAVAVLVVAVVAGRHLLPAGTGTTAGPAGTARTAAGRSVAPTPALRPANPSAAPSGSAPASRAAAGATPSAAPSGTGSLPAVPTDAITPLVVRHATVDMRVGAHRLEPVLREAAALATANGGYVDGSSVTGGTARRSPVSGTITFRVPDAAFDQTVAAVDAFGTVDDQHITGQDVTVQTAQNAAAITVLEDEVALLEKKLSEAPDISTFLTIENQLVPVEKQLQQLQSAEAVLENSAALATVTVSLRAPGAPLAVAPPPRPSADAATTAWRYLRHNSLAVLDAVAVAAGWALPVVVPLALVAAVVLAVVRRRRQVVTPA